MYIVEITAEASTSNIFVIDVDFAPHTFTGISRSVKKARRQAWQKFYDWATPRKYNRRKTVRTCLLVERITTDGGKTVLHRIYEQGCEGFYANLYLKRHPRERIEVVHS